MTIGKPRSNGQRQVFVYDPAIKAKRYVGQRKNLRGPGGAQELEREKTDEFKRRAKGEPPAGLTCQRYAQRWLDLKHGPGTKRPGPRTRDLNRYALTPFLAAFGRGCYVPRCGHVENDPNPCVLPRHHPELHLHADGTTEDATVWPGNQKPTPRSEP